VRFYCAEVLPQLKEQTREPGVTKSMRSISTTAIVAITAVLALLLIAFVFFPSGRSDKRASAPHCVDAAALEAVKRELFRRAAAVRGGNDPGFAQAAQASSVRAASRMTRRPGNGSASCTGTIAIDLPPGVAIVGGRRNVSGTLSYELRSINGGVRLTELDKADALVVPLAALGGQPPSNTQVTEPVVAERGESAPPVTVPAPPPIPRAAQRPPVTRSAPPPAPPRRIQPPKAPTPPRKSQTASAQRKPAPPRTAASPRPVAAEARPAPVAAVRPSFNCRYARTRGEIAVCRNSGLASLDRQMAAEFYSALAVARPGQKAMLQRSRNRFLRVRDACGSEACIANSYRARIGEIRAIMNGGF
jgi:hypothetical protein